MPETNPSLLRPLDACNRCGLCHAVCPVLAATGLEADGPRGHNQLLRLLGRGEVGESDLPSLRESLSTCLLCGACARECPSGVATDELVALGRADLARRLGIAPPVAFLLREALASPGDLSRAASSQGDRLGPLAPMVPLGDPGPSFRQGLGKWSAKVQDLRRRLSAGHTAPVAGGRALAGPTLIYFVGCLTDVFAPQVARAVYAALALAGYQVEVADNMCCGGPHRAAGDREGLLGLAKRNVALLSEREDLPIVTDCATCAHELKSYAVLLGGDPAWAGRAAAVATRVHEACEMLIDGGFRPPAMMDAPTLPVTFHDPCRLVHGLGMREAPRALLRAIPGVELRETDEPGLCCGGPALFVASQPEIALAVRARRLSSIARTDAAVLTTACPECMLWLQKGLREAGQDLPVRHPCELLLDAYRREAAQEEALH